MWIENSIKFIKKHKTEALIIIGVLSALILLLASGCEKQTESKIKTDTKIYEEQIEKRLYEIISGMDGVGNVKIMVTAECGTEYVYAKNEESGENNSKSDYFTNGDKDTVLIKEVEPKIRGVAIVCDGGGNADIQFKIIKLVSGVLKISTNRIFVSS